MGVGASKLTDTWFGGASGHPCCSSAYCFEPYDLDAPPTDESGSSAAGKAIEEYGGSPRSPLLQSPRSTQSSRGAAKGPAYAPGSPAMVGLPEFRSTEARRLYFDWRNLATNAALHGLPAVMQAKSAYEQANQVGRKSTEDALSSLASLSALSSDAETTENPMVAKNEPQVEKIRRKPPPTSKDEDEEEDEVRAGSHAEEGDNAGESEEDDDNAVYEEAGEGGGAKGELGSLDRLGRRRRRRGRGSGLGKR